jgi:two-component system, LytTR family, sensor kinase
MSSPAAPLPPAPPLPTPAPAVRWRVVFGVWGLYGGITSIQNDIAALAYGRHMPIWYGFAVQMPQALCWALLTPLIMYLGRRWPPRGPGWPPRLAGHVLLSLFIVLCIDIMFAFYYPLTDPGGSTGPTVWVRAERAFAYWVVADAMLYWMVLFIGYTRDEGARARAREVRESQLETQLAQAELQALKMQLHPHFLFNALHTVGTLVRTGRSALAVQVVGRLGDLLRRMLDGAAAQEVSLREELEFARNYLEVEQARFPDRLRVTWTVEPGALDAAVPHLVLQPLLENALRHGIAAAANAGILIVGARCTTGTLHLTVRDDGPGLADPARGAGAGGVGLANTRLRLSRLYGDRAGLEVVNADDGGVTSHVFLPFRPAAPGR